MTDRIEPHEIQSFPSEKFGELLHYVYCLVDPRQGKKSVFYIGKGQGNRVFDHERSAENSSGPESEQEVTKRIREIRLENKEVKKWISNFGVKITLRQRILI